jgi:hypothetical protein
MFKFLRFEIGGVSAIFWFLLFLGPYCNIDSLTRVDATKVFAVILGSVALSIPLGNYIHQFSDTLFNPFAKRRLLFWPRAVILYLSQELGSKKKNYSDNSYQAILVFAKSSEIQTKTSGKTKETAVRLKTDLVREEISNRYSYYYARLENGVIAPIVGYGLAFIARTLFAQSIFILPAPAFSPLWLIGVAGVVGFVIVWRIPQLFRELDDLEVTLVQSQRVSWPKI